MNGCVYFVYDSDIKNGDAIIADCTEFFGTGYLLIDSDPGVKLNIFIDDEKLDFNEEEILSFSEKGYHEITLEKLYAHGTKKDEIRFVCLDELRGNPEWGLPPWTPPPFTENTVNLSTSTLTVIHPRTYPSGLVLPVVARVYESGVLSFAKVFCSSSPFLSDIKIKRGFGGMVTKSYPDDGPLAFNAGILTAITSFTEETSVIWTDIGGIISSNIDYPENSRLRITEDMVIPQDVTFTVAQGSVLILNALVNIFCQGNFIVNGSTDAPVVITAGPGISAWGGFIVSGPVASVSMTGCMVTASGGNSGMGHGHSTAQPAFMLRDGASLNFHDVYLVSNYGQALGSESANIYIENSLVQGCETGGELTNGNITIYNSCFTDFPNDDSNYLNRDNDCIYLSGSGMNAIITHSRFMYAKDDGIDSGSNSGGLVSIEDCIFESCFHEGLALSSANKAVKRHTIINSFFTGCGQGIELGYSSTRHEVTVSHCLSYENYIGFRYGDNHTAPVEGSIYILDSIAVGNGKDLWNMRRSDWLPAQGVMIVENCLYAICQPMYGSPEPPALVFDEKMRLSPGSVGYGSGTDGLSIGLIQ